MDISLFRWRDGGWRELALAPDARPVSCAEGHRLRVTVSAGSAPIVHLGGDDLVPKTLGIRNGAVEAVYEFVIDSWAGRTGLVAAGDGEFRRICLDVEPHPGKLGLDAFSGLLMELSARSAALPWGPSPGSRSGRLAGPSAAVVFPAVLDALLPELLRQLRRFLRDPPLAIRRRRDVTPLSMARRPDTQTVRWLVNHPRSLAAVRPGDFGGTGERIAALPLVDQPVAVTNHDHPVTRHLLFQLLRIGRMVDGTVRRLDTLANKGGWRADPFVSAYAARIAGQCRHHRAALAEALSAPAFREAQAEPAGEGALQALADLPAAAAVQRLAHRLLNAGLDLDDNDDATVEAALKRTCDLYEAVVFYRLADTLRTCLGEGWECDAGSRRTRHDDDLETAVIWRRGGETARLLYQRRFPALSAKSAEWHSLTGEFRPDYVISFEKDGACAGWLILDAKYRASRGAVHDALRDLHVYRDALRRHGRRAKPPSSSYRRWPKEPPPMPPTTTSPSTPSAPS